MSPLYRRELITEEDNFSRRRCANCHIFRREGYLPKIFLNSLFLRRDQKEIFRLGIEMHRWIDDDEDDEEWPEKESRVSVVEKCLVALFLIVVFVFANLIFICTAAFDLIEETVKRTSPIIEQWTSNTYTIR